MLMIKEKEEDDNDDDVDDVDDDNVGHRWQASRHLLYRTMSVLMMVVMMSMTRTMMMMVKKQDDMINSNLRDVGRRRGGCY